MKDPLERSNPDADELRAKHATPIVEHQEEVRRLSEETRAAAAEAADKAGEEQRRKEGKPESPPEPTKAADKEKPQEKAEIWREHDLEAEAEAENEAMLNKQFALDGSDEAEHD